MVQISIHAPRAGGDPLGFALLAFVRIISIHAPRAGSDPHCSAIALAMPGFQSTLPVRGATHGVFVVFILSAVFQSTLPVRGATIFQCFPRSNTVISIHAPRAGSDGITAVCKYYLCIFQSTLPVRGATEAEATRSLIQAFQSTLPVRGATIHRHPKQAEKTDFNPRSPCGERRDSRSYRYRWNDFNPRSPCGERPTLYANKVILVQISIHAPRAGGDNMANMSAFKAQLISIHAPRAGSDEIVGLIVTVGMISIHAPRAGSDPFYFLVPYRYKFYFNPRSPCGERHWGLLY